MLLMQILPLRIYVNHVASYENECIEKKNVCIFKTHSVAPHKKRSKKETVLGQPQYSFVGVLWALKLVIHQHFC